MSRRGVSQTNKHQIARMEDHMIDPFTHMKQMMRGFGGFGDDMFSLMDRSDPFEDMFKFSNMHQNIHNKGKQGSYVCQTFTSSSVMGPDGKMKTQNYYENSMGEHRGGHTISQKQQAYKNSDGINRIAEERMLDNKGRKIMREKIGRDGQIQQSNHYFNIDEEQAQKFDQQWRGANQKMKFLQNHQKYVRDDYGQKALGYQNHYKNQPQSKYQGKHIDYQPSEVGSKNSKFSSKTSTKKY